MTTPVRSEKDRQALLWPFLALVFWLLSFLPLYFTGNTDSEPAALNQTPQKILVNQKLSTPSLYLQDSTCSALMHIEAEQYLRFSGIETEICDDFGGGWNIAWIENNDFSTYKVHVPVKGLYQFHFRVASATLGGNIEVFFKNQLLFNLNVPGTDGWHNWRTISTQAILPEGDNEIALRYIGGEGFLFNVNWFEMELLQADKSIYSKNEEVPLDFELRSTSNAHNLYFSLPAKKFQTLEIRNLNGERTFKTDIKDKGPDLLISIPKRQLPKGVYWIYLLGEAEKAQHKILIP